ncbi:MAG: HAMP domain-containing histidine kinase [Lachnospiraceae bacterium]|nr:HAMP domain-containing histidine kinase [Lachnospiraceae bacterium]
MSDPKESKTPKTDPKYVCAGASACLALIGIIIYKICQSKMNIAIDNLRSYYGSVDNGLFLTQQEYLLRQALLISILIPVIAGVLLLIALFIFLDRMIPASYKKRAANGSDEKTGSQKDKRAKLNEKKTDLIQLIGKVVDSYAPRMEEKKITFTVEDDDVEEPVVMCDADAVESIVKKLINNAYRSAPEGGRVYMALKQFYVSDEGYGIYELTVEDDGTEKSEDPALSGADIDDAKEIAESMDGELETETVKGVGNGVTVRLDLKVVREETKHTENAPDENAD